MFLTDYLNPPKPTDSDVTLLRLSRRAMATRFEIALPYQTPNGLAAGTEALDLIDQIEDQLTVYRDTSEVSRMNRSASFEAFQVDETLFRLLQQCAVLTRDTDGAFDVAIGALISCWGFQQREGRVPAEPELSHAARISGFRHVILDEAKSAVRYRKEGLTINLGAIGKGYALDRAADLLKRRWGIRSALLHAGGSSVYALGRESEAHPWRVSIRHPWEDRDLCQVELENQGFGTSAATYQYFVHEGKKYGHVIHPRTGRPAEGVQSASVIAPTAAEADAISTAAFVSGLAWSREYFGSRPQYSARLLANTSNDVVVL